MVVVFDVTNRASLDAIRRWLSEIKSHCDDIPRILVGNKSDCAHREVSPSEGREMASRYNLQYLETSAKTGSGVDDAFGALADIIINRRDQSNRQAAHASHINSNIKIKNKKGKKSKKSKCDYL